VISGTAAPKGEQIPAPKEEQRKMPEGGAKKATQLYPQPATSAGLIIDQ
jgi:hypothetical protein